MTFFPKMAHRHTSQSKGYIISPRYINISYNKLVQIYMYTI